MRGGGGGVVFTVEVDVARTRMGFKPLDATRLFASKLKAVPWPFVTMTLEPVDSGHTLMPRWEGPR